MRVFILGKHQFDSLMRQNNLNDENVESRGGIFLISIVDTDQFSESREPFFKEDHKNVLNLAFDDCEHDGQPSPTQPEGTRAFNEEQATKLFEFIKKHRDKEQCVVHCMAGISRSGAVGTFINGYAGGDWDEFKRTNTQISPNARVHRMLNEAKYNEK
jgi:predicted protein tyrosine phosphatase